MNKEDEQSLKGVWEDLVAKFPDGYNDMLHPSGFRVILGEWAYDFDKFKEWAEMKGYEKGKRLTRDVNGSCSEGQCWTGFLKFNNTPHAAGYGKGGSYLYVGAYHKDKLLHFEYLTEPSWDSACKAKKGKYKAFNNEVAVRGLSKLKGLSYKKIDKDVGDGLRFTDIWNNFHSSLEYKYGNNTVIGVKGHFVLTKCSKCGKVSERTVDLKKRRWWSQASVRWDGCKGCSEARGSGYFLQHANDHKKVCKMGTKDLVKLGVRLEYGY